MLKFASNEFAATATSAIIQHQQRPPVRTSASTSNSQSSSNQFESSAIKLTSSCSVANSNKLKSSTIAKVLPANKSRLRQPVAAFGEGQPAAVAQQQLAPNSKQSRLAKPTTTATGARARPTSLTLKGSPESRVALPTRLAGVSSTSTKLGASILPKSSQAKTLAAAGLLTTIGEGGGAANGATTVSGGKIPTNSQNTITTVAQSEPASKNSISAGSQSQSSAKKGSPANKQTGELNSTKYNSAGLNVEPRSSRLKNFIAIVHPQHTQRCLNSSVTTTTTVNNKLVSPTTAKFTSLSTNARLESGKVNFNHRDANGRPDREGKQDGSQNVARHLKTTTAATEATSSNDSPASIEVSNTQDGNFSLSKATPTNKDKTSDWFALNSTVISSSSNKNSNNLLSVASSGGVPPGNDDKKQHGNNKQSNKRLRARTHSLGLKTTVSTGATTITAAAAGAATTTIAASITTRETAEVDDDARDGDDEDDSERGLKANNCYNHIGAKSTIPKSPAIYFKRSTNDQQAINDCLLPKPMGQQVLSLMMLDVGLMPANNGKQKSSSSTRRSHVRLQDPLRQGLGANSVKSRFIGTNGGGHLNHERDSINRSNCSSINDCLDYEQCNNYHSLQTAHDMLRSQVRFSNQDNEHFRSYSLPASPRLRVSGQINQRFNRGQAEAVSSALKHFFASENRSTRPLELNNSCSLHAASPVLINEQFNHANRDHSTCDNQDSHSVGSSSCSSLNHHCPPLLSLSNQLNGLKFEELVRASSVGLAGIQSNNSGNGNNKKQSCNNQSSKNLSIANNTSVSTVGATKPSSDQVAQVAKQHELLTNDLNCAAERHHSNKIDHAVDVYSLANERLLASKGSSQQIHDHSETSQNRQSRASSNRANRDDESSLEFQLRRQQQPRSHSISGQEFHSNGGYQRLKHALYTQPQQTGASGGIAFDGYNNQGYNNMTQPANRAQQISSPFQQQHHLLLGRSPSPLSVNCQTNYGSPQRDCSMKYGLDRQPRNQLHASLECLNTGYSEYHQAQQQQQFQQQHHHQQQSQQQQQYHNQHQLQQQQQIQHQQHYAASYILAAPPANTIINQNGDQDLAAAAMETPSSQYHSTATNGCGPYSQQTQNLINRAMAQVAQSPLRRIGLSNTSNTSGASSGILNHLSSLQHPMRAGHSSLSLASSSFIIEDKLQNEIRKLQSELKSEKEKNEALNSQLNINSSLMAAFEQSLTTLNTRLRQLTALNEKKDEEIEKLAEQLRALKSPGEDEYKASPNGREETHTNNTNNKYEGENDGGRAAINSEKDRTSEQNLMKLVEDLKRQLIEKDRLLTDTRLEALSAAHQLEQLESKLNGENSLLVNEDDLDEGVMVVNHSPSDSDAITDSAHFSEINSQISKPSQRCNGDSTSCTVTNNINANENNLENSMENNNNVDYQSNHSSDYQLEIKAKDQQTTMSESESKQFNGNESGAMSELLDSLLLT